MFGAGKAATVAAGMSDEPDDVEQVRAWLGASGGDTGELLERVYSELRQVADRLMADERANPHAAANRPRARGVPAAPRIAARPVRRAPRLPRARGCRDAAHPDRPRAQPTDGEARRRLAPHHAAGSRRKGRGAGHDGRSRPGPARPGAREAGGARCATSEDRGAAVLQRDERTGDRRPSRYRAEHGRSAT